MSTVGVAPDAIAGLALTAAPNPARGSQALTFPLRARGPARIELYDVAGRQVRLLALDGEPGVNRVRWDGRDAAGAVVPAGLYFARLTGGSETASIKVLRLD